MKKAARLTLVLLLVAAGGLLAFAGAQTQEYRTVTDLVDDPARFESGHVEVKAVVKPGSLERTPTRLSFLVEDEANAIPVLWEAGKPVPEHEAGGTLEGRTVVLKGHVHRAEDGTLVFAASDMQVGCASKYEPAPAAPA